MNIRTTPWPSQRRLRLEPHRIPGLLVLGLLALLAWLGLVVAPPDLIQGEVQRIMYVHVPSAWVAYLAFAITALGSLLYLWRRTLSWDRLAVASAEVGVLFTGLAIVTGSIWGQATWGVWWDWDPRLTTTAILFISFVGYLVLRASIVDRHRRARSGAVLGIAAFLNVPVVHFSVVWWRGLHQPPTVMQPEHPPIDHVLLFTLLFGTAAFTLLFGWLLRDRLDLERVRDDILARLEGDDHG